MAEYVTNPATTPQADLSGTAFSHLDVRWLVNQERSGSSLTGVGQTIYPAPGGTHEAHYHPNAEETVIVLEGHGTHRVGDEVYDIGPGDVVFIPRNVVHTAAAGDEDMKILWVLAGASTLEGAGYVAVPDPE